MMFERFGRCLHLLHLIMAQCIQSAHILSHLSACGELVLPLFSLRMMMGGGWCFRVPPFNRHSFAAPVSGRSARDCCAIGGLMRRNAVPISGRPVQHHPTHPAAPLSSRRRNAPPAGLETKTDSPCPYA